MSTATHSAILAAPGGSFLLENRTPDETFTPEDLNEEQRQITATAIKFAADEITAIADKIEAKEPGVMKGVLKKAADLGFTSVDIPEEYGGMGMDKTTSTLLSDRLSVLASFCTAYGAHIGIGTLPLTWYGTAEQKQRYLPRIASGEWVAAYALSEATSGSDALNVRARARLSEDGKEYILDGEKMWITNAGFADIYTVFAKLVEPDGSEKFTAFLVERTSPGLSVGAEEHKLGIRGSSTCPLILSGCRIPVNNLLGEAGKGHHIAFNILNVGRFKLGVACVGGARHVLTSAIKYAAERKAFGKSIDQFGLIQRKIAVGAARLYAAESMAYRLAGMLDASLEQIPAGQAHDSREVQKRIEEYAVECSILKVYGSEMLSYIADEQVSIMGGYGFVEDYSAERSYRDARINRIFEGTNEINRLIITGWLMKRAMKGQLPLMQAIKKLMDEVTQPSLGESIDESLPLAREVDTLTAVRKTALFAAGVASQRFMMGLEEQQEIMGDLADCIMNVFALDSAILRAQKLVAAGSAKAAVATDLCGLLAAEAHEQVELAARRVLAACAEGDMLRTQLTILRRVMKVAPANVVEIGRRAAAACTKAGSYPWM
jgi:butyryl-CoA dehydrogenase